MDFYLQYETLAETLKLIFFLVRRFIETDEVACSVVTLKLLHS